MVIGAKKSKEREKISDDKKIILVVCSLIIATFAITSCSEKSVSSTNENQYTKVGKMHNEGLAHLYNSLKMKQELLGDKKKMFQFVENDLGGFISNSLTCDLETEIVALSLGCDLINKIEEKKSEKDDNSLRIALSIYENLFTDLQKQYILELSIIIDNHNCNIETLKIKVEELNQKIINNISNQDERRVVLNATSVCLSSFSYWDENLLEWYGLYQFSKDGTTDELPTKEELNVVKADIGSSDVAGALTGVVVGSVIPGAGTAGGAIGGAIGASSVAAIYKLIDWFEED